MSKVSLIDIHILNKLLSSVAEEMGIVLKKSAFSANIKERKDFSCAIFDSKARLLAQAAHIPVHLGAMPMTVSNMLKLKQPYKGDVIWSNDPFLGGTHLPDITMLKAVFLENEDEPIFYVVCRAHHADIGGKYPGSMALVEDIKDEGVMISPEYIIKNKQIIEKNFNHFLTQVRKPEERKGDILAQLACLERGSKRLIQLVKSWGKEKILSVIDMLIDYGERVMKETIKEIPNGEYEFCDALDDDGFNKEPIWIKVNIKIKDDQAILDFSNTDRQVKSSINTVKSVTASCCYYVFFCLLGEDYPINHGSLAPIKIVTQPATIVDAQRPAPVAAGNVETSQRIVDVILGALSKALPDKIPAASCGTMNNVSFGGIDPRNNKEFTYYETIGGGMGASPNMDGLSAVQVHMTNTLNTPIEAIEYEYPVMIEKYKIRRNSGGCGKFKGGDGIIRSFKFLFNGTLSLLTERRIFSPYGLYGGTSGKKGKNLVFIDDKIIKLSGKTTINIKKGDILEIYTPGGGGWGIDRG